MHCIYSVDLKNEVLQFCMYVAQGLPHKALQLVPNISIDLRDWLASVLEVSIYPIYILYIYIYIKKWILYIYI